MLTEHGAHARHGAGEKSALMTAHTKGPGVRKHRQMEGLTRGWGLEHWGGWHTGRAGGRPQYSKGLVNQGVEDGFILGGMENPGGSPAMRKKTAGLPSLLKSSGATGRIIEGRK